MTSYVSRVSKNLYRIEYETDNYDNYLIIQNKIRKQIDKEGRHTRAKIMKNRLRILLEKIKESE